jgi:hypothetical protein
MSCMKGSDLTHTQKRALGRIHLTTDIWSDSFQLTSFVGLSAHYCVMGPDGHLTMASSLIAFSEIDKTHSGENIAELIYNVLFGDGILHKVTCYSLWQGEDLISNQLGMITCDNASNNDTMMTALAELLKNKVSFDATGNRIRSVLGPGILDEHLPCYFQLLSTCRKPRHEGRL